MANRKRELPIIAILRQEFAKFIVQETPAVWSLRSIEKSMEKYPELQALWKRAKEQGDVENYVSEIQGDHAYRLRLEQSQELESV